MADLILPPIDKRGGIPFRTFVPELDKTYVKPINFIYVGTPGDLVVKNISLTPIKFKNVRGGVTIEGFFVEIVSSGTTASNLVAQRI